MVRPNMCVQYFSIYNSPDNDCAQSGWIEWMMWCSGEEDMWQLKCSLVTWQKCGYNVENQLLNQRVLFQHIYLEGKRNLAHAAEHQKCKH